MTRRNADAGLTFSAFLHLLMIFQHNIARISQKRKRISLQAAIYDVQVVSLPLPSV
jgi:hypothetical protein